MFFAKKKAISNRLTELIEANDNVDLEEVLLHEDFQQTVEKQSNILYQRVLKEEEKPWFYKIIDYSLFDAVPPKKYEKYNKIHQININASNFLENCGRDFIIYFKINCNDTNIINHKRLQYYLEDTISRFIEEPKCNTNPMYAGHFQRFIENFLKLGALDPETTFNDLISFLANNCHILAYQQLISKLLISDELVYDTQIYKLLSKILNRAVLAVKFIRDQINSKRATSFLESTISSEEFNKYLTIDSQPFNIKKRPIPLPEVRYIKEEEIMQSEKETQFITFLTKPEESEVNYTSIEDAEFTAYLIIMTIRSSSLKKINIINYFRDDQENGYQLIQSLFFCGIYCGSNSLISLEAFKLLGIIFNGSIPYSIKKWKASEEKKSELSFYNDFANEMNFNSSDLTCKMVHALPLFWNHRYNLNEYELSDEEKKIIDTSDYYNDGKKHERKREKGETALEILQPCLLSEPPISSQLIYSCTDIFIQLSRERRNVLHESTKNKSEQMISMDAIILDFYNHHFDFGQDILDTSFSNLLLKGVIIPLLISDIFYLTQRIFKRIVLNGFLVDFSCRMSNMRTNPFFQIFPDKQELITIMGRQKCFVNTSINASFYYKFIDIDVLSESTIYVKYSNSNHGEKEDIIVDEFTFESFSLTEGDETKKEDLFKSTKSLRSFRPKVKAITEDGETKQKTKQDISKESEIEKAKIRQFEEILSITSHRPNSHIKNEANHFIDSDEEDKYHTNAGVIGEGGTSVTYKIIDKRTKVPMCKKVLKYRKGQTAIKNAQNALKEFEILQRISHPCICKAIGINISEKIDTKKDDLKDYSEYEEEEEEKKEKEVTTIALFLEYVDYNLSDFLSTKLVNNTTKTRIILDVVHAMNYLHKHNMMHRDLKIENIMLNSFFETKIVDFGFASISESVIDGFSYVTNSLTKGIGTFAYMSPEMANMDEYTNKTDVYSFGVILHFMFTGSLPKQNLKDKMAGKPVKMPKPSSSISRFCIKLIQQCLAYDESKRPSFDEILTQIRENSYELASGVDPSILSKRDKELDFIENYK